VSARYDDSQQRKPFWSLIVMRKALPVAALLAATSLAFAQPKVSGGDTPPADSKAAQEKAAAEQARRDAAKKALGALKGSKEQDQRGQGSDRKPAGR
jgi:hypothetical protein